MPIGNASALWGCIIRFQVDTFKTSIKPHGWDYLNLGHCKPPDAALWEAVMFGLYGMYGMYCRTKYMDANNLKNLSGAIDLGNVHIPMDTKVE